MRKIICNTTPILSLIKINKLDLLEKLYGKIIIPYAVFEEVEEGKEKQYYQDLSKLSWIEIENVKNQLADFRFDKIDDGEAEVLILAKEKNADLVIMDELMGRRFARQIGLKLTGTMGILLKAKEKGFINSVSELLNELQNKGTWLNPKLVSKVKKLAGEE